MSKQVTGSLLGRIRSLFLRASRDEEGATAVEFAFLAPVFFALIFSAIEFGIVLTKVALLENGAAKVSRTIYTGLASSGATTREQIEEVVCDTVSVFAPDCEDNIAIELTPVANFQSIPSSEAVCKNSSDPISPVTQFVPGVANEIVYLRICLSTQLMTPGLGAGLHLPQTDDGKVQLIAALAFSNEPF